MNDLNNKANTSATCSVPLKKPLLHVQVASETLAVVVLGRFFDVDIKNIKEGTLKIA